LTSGDFRTAARRDKHLFRRARETLDQRFAIHDKLLAETKVKKAIFQSLENLVGKASFIPISAGLNE
jgi:hypothetical protein